MLNRLLFTILFITPTLLHAAVCPSNYDWIHDGTGWHLSADAQAAGWIISKMDDTNFDGKLPLRSQLTIFLTSNSARCTYHFHVRGKKIDFVIDQKQHIKTSHISEPPFFNNRLGEYYCVTYAGYPERCTWPWKSEE